MGTELFKSSLSRPNNCSSNETVEKNLGSEPKYSALIINYLKFLLNEIKDKQDIKLSDEANIKALSVRLNAIRFWISNYILIEDRILAFIAFGNTISVQNFLKTLVQFGIYLPRRILQQSIIDKSANLKRAYLEDPQFALNVFSVLTDNWNYGLVQDYNPKQILHEDEVIFADERLTPRKFLMLHSEKQTDAIAKQIVKTIPKRSKLASEPIKTEMKKAKQLFVTCASTLRQDIGFFITEVFKNPTRHFSMCEVIIIGFNWNFNQRNIKDCPFDFVTTNDKPPPDANYIKLNYNILKESELGILFIDYGSKYNELNIKKGEDLINRNLNQFYESNECKCKGITKVRKADNKFKNEIFRYNWNFHEDNIWCILYLLDLFIQI